MLHLKRASAGSGKTYELAKTYIKLLLTLKEHGKKRRLRSEESLQDSLASIMAVTFTVKATAEMKQRIVEKLAALAGADRLTPEQYGDVDYLESFMQELNASCDDIARMARSALRILLLHYSDFKVQTIDAFFQSILHTFAYEANLDENFNMEIDTDYITSVGFDSALDSIATATNEKDTDQDTMYWLGRMMREEQKSNRWNVFARSENERSLYSVLINEAKNLEKEDFQGIRNHLQDYFGSLEKPFRDIVAEVDEANLKPWIELHNARREAARELQSELQRAHLGIEDIYRKPKSLFEASLKQFDLKDLKEIKVPSSPSKTDADSCLSGTGKTNFKNTVASYDNINPSSINDIASAYWEWMKASAEYKEAYEDPDKKMALATWRAYRKLLPQLMVVLEIARQKREFLDATNTLEISDTTHILSRIIGKDDTPFVYERMGARLNHYLIDEFQDTSRMQWHNLFPLLDESESRDNDNLIIGDAKQSIYRFRNADYRLITDEVERSFNNIVPYTSDNPPADPAAENTNYRSKAKIIKFNNFVFSHIVNIQDKDEADIFNDKIREIYSGATQAIPSKTGKQDKGFVDIKIYPHKKSDQKEQSEKVGFLSIDEPGFAQLPTLVLSLKERGYRFRDIGVLVKTHDQGKAVVKSIAAYNNLNPSNQISIISEENLLVSSSLCVKLIVHALQMVAQGLQRGIPVNPVIEEPVDESRLFELLASLQSQALPSVVEAVIDRFLPSERRDEEAPFLAAFQDAVLDYSSTHTSDIGSFLKWWKRKSKKLSISSPEESDGVRINTIHGSKGLEYKCVVIPYANLSFRPSRFQSEWRWVRPSDMVCKNELLPPFLPVATTSDLGETVHSALWDRYCEEFALDELNKMYVGFTRARNELYVYAPLGAMSTATASYALTELFAQETPLGDARDDIPEIISPATDLEEGSIEIRYGAPLSPEDIAAENRKEGKPVEKISTYRVCSDRKLLQFQDGNRLLQDTLSGEGDVESEPDPRAEGTLKHRIMQLIERPLDLERALLEIRVTGLASKAQTDKWKQELSRAIESVSEYGWFDNNVRVLNERTLIRKGKGYLRPDRIIERPDGSAVIVDYKFGSPHSAHKTQLRDYSYRLAATGRYRCIDSYLWYVTSGEVVKL